MASFKKIMFGDPPFRFLAGHLAQDKEFISEMRPILKLDQARFLRLATQLQKTNDFLDRLALGAIAEESLGEGREATKIAVIIHKLAGILRGADLPPDKAMAALASAINSKATSLKPEDRQTLSERIRALALEPGGISRQYKAQDLVGAIGAELGEFRFVCDIRPVFDKQRERIEGAIPIAVLKLEYSEQDGDSNVIELRITEKQIAALEEKIADARRKLKVISESLTGQRIPIPSTESAEIDSENE